MKVINKFSVTLVTSLTKMLKVLRFCFILKFLTTLLLGVSFSNISLEKQCLLLSAGMAILTKFDYRVKFYPKLSTFSKNYFPLPITYFVIAPIILILW